MFGALALQGHERAEPCHAVRHLVQQVRMMVSNCPVNRIVDPSVNTSMFGCMLHWCRLVRMVVAHKNTFFYQSLHSAFRHTHTHTLPICFFCTSCTAVLAIAFLFCFYTILFPSPLFLFWLLCRYLLFLNVFNITCLPL